MNSSAEVCIPATESVSTPKTRKTALEVLPSLQANSAARTERPVDVGLGWAAGFIDGEGHFSITVQKRDDGTKRYYPRINVTNVDRYTLECLKHTYGGAVSSHGRAFGKHRQCYRWSIGGEHALAFANKVQRFILTKKRTIKLFIQFCRYRDQAHPNLITLARYKMRLRALNRRGI